MKRHAAKRVRLVIEELEPRILYSADAGALANPAALTQGAEVRSLDAYAMPVAAPEAANTAAAPADAAAAQTADAPPAADAVAQTRHEIAFVDTQVADYQQIVDDLTRQNTVERQIEVVLLDASRDGIEQIGETLQNRHEIDAVHIFSHGVDGALELGDAWLNSYSLEARADAISQWGTALSANADILLYGCDVAADGQGQAFVNRLGQLTGADVAASRDATGSAALGANWDLEYTTGAIETSSVIDALAQQQYGDVLAITVDNTVSGVQVMRRR